MKKMVFFSVLVFGILCFTLKAYPEYEFGRTLEKPEWGLIEWESATLPEGFWYPSFGFQYVSRETYFSAGKEVDFEGGRDSSAYVLEVGLIYGLSDKLNPSVYIPFVLDQKVDTGQFRPRGNKISGLSGFGDIEVGLKYHLINRYFWSVASEVGVTLPTGTPHNKVSSKQTATGDGQTDLSLALGGDILLTEEGFIKLGTCFVYQFKRTFRDTSEELVEEKLGNSFCMDVGGVRNFKNMGIAGTLQYTFWQATKVDEVVVTPDSDLFNMFLQLSLGDSSPEKHGKLDLTLNFPLTGKNASANYRLGISLKTIFR
jgi:hypothetical protein